jgi:hypothetical protein
MNQAGGEGEPLFPAAGKLTGELVLPAFQTELRDALPNGGPAIFHVVHPAHELEIFFDTEVFPKAEALRHVTDFALDRFALADDVVAEHLAAPFIRSQQPAKHAQESGFAAPIRAEEAVDFARPHPEVNVIDYRAGAEAFRHPVNVDCLPAVFHCLTKRTSTG